jgi:solute carrier family 25 (mitochondrial uncoupling protein), member 8/9
MITGTVAITVANPTDVVKVRLQNQGNSSISNKNHMRYSGALDCYQKIIKLEGVSGLWTSWSANVVRNSIINAAELASYDQYKQILIQGNYMRDATPCYLTCAFGAGFTAVIVGSPLDIVTTRQMNSPGMYKNPYDCLSQIIKKEGILALYKGFLPNVARLGCFNMILWATLE